MGLSLMKSHCGMGWIFGVADLSLFSSVFILPLFYQEALSWIKFHSGHQVGRSIRQGGFTIAFSTPHA